MGPDVHPVHDAAVRNGGAGPDVDRNARRGVQHATVLHVCALADNDGGEVGAKDGIEPDRRTRLDVHVTDKDSGGGDKSARIDHR